MVGRGAKLSLVVACLLGAAARGAGGDPVGEAAAELRAALREGNYGAASDALAQAEALHQKVAGEKFEPMLRAVASGVKHRDVSIAIAAVRTLGRLQVAGSGRYLGRLLKPPKRVKPQRFRLHLAAIEAAGSICDPDSTLLLVKLVDHPETDFAVAATQSLRSYTVLEREARLDLIERLAVTLGRLEKRSPRSVEDKIHVSVVTNALTESLAKLTGEPGLRGSSDVRAWLWEERKRLQDAG